MTNLLERLVKDLGAQGYQARYEAANNNQPLPHVFVELGSGRLQLALASSAQESLGEQVDTEVDYLQFFMPLSFQVKKEQFGATSELLAHLNATIPLVGFCLVRDQGQVAFRHLMIIERDQIVSSIVAEAVDTIDFLLETFGNIISDVASRRQSIEQAFSRLRSS